MLTIVDYFIIGANYFLRRFLDFTFGMDHLIIENNLVNFIFSTQAIENNLATAAFLHELEGCKVLVYKMT